MTWSQAQSLPWWELTPLIENLLDSLTEPEWSHTDENLATLLDTLTYWLGSEYAQWTTDPEDPEVQAAREERKRSGVKPPPVPLVTPVASRPPRWAQAARDRLEALKAAVEQQKPKKKRMRLADLLAMRRP